VSLDYSGHPKKCPETQAGQGFNISLIGAVLCQSWALSRCFQRLFFCPQMQAQQGFQRKCSCVAFPFFGCCFHVVFSGCVTPVSLGPIAAKPYSVYIYNQQPKKGKQEFPSDTE
jgi:hypothetical protein